jgi:hypothetical protein
MLGIIFLATPGQICVDCDNLHRQSTVMACEIAATCERGSLCESPPCSLPLTAMTSASFEQSQEESTFILFVNVLWDVRGGKNFRGCLHILTPLLSPGLRSWTMFVQLQFQPRSYC